MNFFKHVWLICFIYFFILCFRCQNIWSIFMSKLANSCYSIKTWLWSLAYVPGVGKGTVWATNINHLHRTWPEILSHDGCCCRSTESFRPTNSCVHPMLGSSLQYMKINLMLYAKEENSNKLEIKMQRAQKYFEKIKIFWKAARGRWNGRVLRPTPTSERATHPSRKIKVKICGSFIHDSDTVMR